MSIAADARTAHRMTRGGAGFRRRLRHAMGLMMAGTALLSACAQPSTGTPTATGSSGSAATAAAPALDEGSQAACLAFWGDPGYTAPLLRDVLDRAATAPENGPSDPMFYALTGDDVESAFADADDDLRASASAVAEWFRTDAAAGEDADLEELRTGITTLADGCAPVSAAATWFAGQGEDGTKPAALTCADVFDTPGTFTVFANANVLTSNMFKLVGRTPQQVDPDDMDEIEGALDLLDAEIAAVDDDGVRAALEQVRVPFADAADGDLSSDGLQDPLEQLGTACGAAGYDAGVGGQDQDGQEADDAGDEGLV